jgi:hypothetical protein
MCLCVYVFKSYLFENSYVLTLSFEVRQILGMKAQRT